MNKNRTMRVAAALLVLVLVTCCMVGGTFAKYVTAVTDTDSVRIAHWGFYQRGMIATPEATIIRSFFDLFDSSYANDEGEITVQSGNGDNVVAPGTEKETQIRFVYNDSGIANVEAPEVDYDLTVEVSLNEHDLLSSMFTPNVYPQRLNWYYRYTNAAGEEITKTFTDYRAFLVALAELSGAKGVSVVGKDYKHTATGTFRYEAGTLPEWLTGDSTLTVGWGWAFEGTGNWDTIDTMKGNLASTMYYSDDLVFTIRVIAEQVD